MNPLVSVILSVYNARPYLEECIDSVLRQTYRDFEFLIVDDGSTDDSWEIVKKFSDQRMITFQIKNCGVARAKNFLLEKARGEWIAVIDADDVWHPLKLEIQIKYLKMNPDCVLAGTFARIIDKEGFPLHIEPKITDWQSLSQMISKRNLFTHSSVIYRLDACKQVGGYNISVHHYLADYELMKALCSIGKAVNLPVPLVRYRIVPHSVTSGFSLSNQKVSARRRAANYHYILARMYIFYTSKRRRFLYNIMQSIMLNPIQLRAYALLAAGLTPLIRNIIRKKILNKEHFSYISQLSDPEEYLSNLSQRSDD